MDKKINARKKAQRLARQRKMRNRRIALTICLMIAISLVSIGGTIAWLTATTGTVTNTFTVGNIAIDLYEHKLNNDGSLTTGTEDADITRKGIDTYKMVPGNTLNKDPLVTVKANSEASWLFVKVEKVNAVDTFLTYMITDGWKPLNDQDKPNGEGVYYREVDATTADVSFPVIGVEGTDDDSIVAESNNAAELNKVAVKNTVTKANMDALTDTTRPQLKFTAYACQKANVNTAADAWAILNPTT